ncbi:MAG: SPOR domain-containing protein [Halieaceae bacterium]
MDGYKRIRARRNHPKKTAIWHTITYVVLLTLVASRTAATTLEQGYEAINQGNPGEAIAIWEELATAGDQTAQLNLAELYREGKLIPNDDSLAVEWYSMAARQGSGTARYYLLLMRENNRATDEDLNFAFAIENMESQGSSAESQTRKTQAREWIQRVSPDTVMLQLLGSSNERALHHYADEHLADIQPPVRVLPTRVKNQDWYLLVMGPFPNKDKANQVIGSLPPEIRSNKPWIRSTDSIQQLQP